MSSNELEAAGLTGVTDYSSLWEVDVPLRFADFPGDLDQAQVESSHKTEPGDGMLVGDLHQEGVLAGPHQGNDESTFIANARFDRAVADDHALYRALWWQGHFEELLFGVHDVVLGTSHPANV